MQTKCICKYDLKEITDDFENSEIIYFDRVDGDLLLLEINKDSNKIKPKSL